VSAQESFRRIKADLRKQALAYPETTEDFPWGHSAFKVKGKTFLFTYLNEEEGFLSLSMKLPSSGRAALLFPFAKPTEYGLGKSGWVTAKFDGSEDVPIEMLLEWVDESFRAVAPKRVLARMEAGETDEAPVAKRPKKRPSR
jgi:predicted DNA-binding protein (MmcQ/YjbR family)